MPSYGIDVSSHNAITSWAQVRTANTWAWSKATQGAGYISPLFAAQMTAGRAAGMAMGAYHFADPNVSVQANVDHFVSVAAPLGAFRAGAWLPLLDIENDPSDSITWSGPVANAFIVSFRDRLRAATGVHQLCVYASQSWFTSGMLRPDAWADDGVFLCAARYGVKPAAVGWSHRRLAIHQYTDSAPTPGAADPTDRSVVLDPFTAADLTVGGHPATPDTEDDDMFHFIADLSTPLGAGQTGYSRVAMLRPNGTLTGVSWAEAASKDKTYGGDGTGSILGVSKGEFDDAEADSNDIKAANKALAKLTGTGGPAGPVTITPGAYVINGTVTPKES